LGKRTLYAIPALAMLLSTIYFYGLYAQLVVAAMAVLCVHEMMGAVACVGRPIRLLGYIYAVLLYPAYSFVGGFLGIAILTAVGMMAVFTVLVLTGRDAIDGLLTVLPMLYPGLFFAFMLALFCIEQPDISRFLVIIAFGAAVITDTFAYFCGRLFGKHKLIPHISPKKTVEGAIGGLVFGTVAVVLLGALLQGSFHISMNPLWYGLLGFVLSMLTQIGDLAASLVKRRLGIKDYGHIMGEHGGAMDRLDSVLFISPAVFAFYFVLVA
jgi:phosphatidate cytidylyltransferase